jgi:hypothetical protein
MDHEELPCVVSLSKHIKAIVRNAKAKRIEGTFGVLESILRNMGVPGSVKRLTDSGEKHRADDPDGLLVVGDNV